jgi:putative pyruvate formate lyase activating enzyme
MAQIYPGYLSLLKSGELEQRAISAQIHLSICDVCPLCCPVDRYSGNLGVCRTGALARISSFTPHHGEEDPIRGWRGSGTIFFNRCNLHCQFCQNHDISQSTYGNEVDPTGLARMMLRLQALGCHNINLVSPSHVIPQVLAAVLKAAEDGLNIPLVYNSGGYDSVAMLTLLDGVIDIYMPDMKYGDSQNAMKYSKIKDYVQINQQAVKEMHRQVGDLIVDCDGIAIRGLLIRHLILPNSLAGTETITKFIAREISTNTYFNLMDQYYPCFNAHQYPELNRLISIEEYEHARQVSLATGLHRLDP